MEEKLKDQIQQAIAVYCKNYNQADVPVVTVQNNGRSGLEVSLKTEVLMSMEQLNVMNALVWSLMPIGIMFEVVNVPSDPAKGEMKITHDGGEVNISVIPETLPRVLANINTSDDVTMPVSKKGKR